MHPWRGVIESGDTKVAELRDLYVRNRGNPRFLAEVAALLEVLDEDAAWRALWILKAAAGDGVLGAREIETIVQSAGNSRHWAARLVFCQLLAQVDCPEEHREALQGFLLECFTDRRVITRAWALSAMWRFRRDPRFRAGIERCVRDARKDHGKAMQARLRHLR